MMMVSMYSSFVSIVYDSIIFLGGRTLWEVVPVMLEESKIYGTQKSALCVCVCV